MKEAGVCKGGCTALWPEMNKSTGCFTLLLQQQKLTFNSAVICVSVWQKTFLVVSVLYCCQTHTHKHTGIYAHTPHARLYFLSRGNEYDDTFLKLYSRVSAYKSWSDPSHLLFLSTISPIKCKHKLTHTVTGHFIFSKVKGHSIWQHSIAYSCEMNLDCNKIDN